MELSIKLNGLQSKFQTTALTHPCGKTYSLFNKSDINVYFDLTELNQFAGNRDGFYRFPTDPNNYPKYTLS